MLKHFIVVAPTCFGPYLRPSSGAREQYFVQLLSWILLMYVCYVFVQYEPKHVGETTLKCF